MFNVYDYLERKLTVQCMAHRGFSGMYPENTLLAFNEAIKINADLIEFDVRVSGDGVPVVIHDASVDRTTDGSGLVSELSVDELKHLDAGLGEKIPTLQETLDLIKGKIMAFLEIKEDNAVPLVAEELNRFDLWEDIMITSFNKNHLVSIREYRDFVYTGFIYINPKSGGIVTGIKVNAFAVLPYYKLATNKAIAFAHRAKMIVVPWTVDTLDVAKKLKENGADGISSNRPDIMLSLK